MVCFTGFVDPINVFHKEPTGRISGVDAGIVPDRKRCKFGMYNGVIPFYPRTFWKK
jgi:hypothetical protein